MTWVRVAGADELPAGEALKAEIDGTPVCVVRLDAETVKAVHDVCSHEDEALHEGWVEDNAIECPAHGSMFDLDSGEPTMLPATRPVPSYRARIAEGAIWVDRDQQLNDAPEPRH
ncbi:MAG: Rieske (2Fe-2S) protein [Actinobacteria bacterium QS_8_72_14]|jgi:3-phenylpropionate/trans-cinnamate dioxygenase ferredoxin subunit|nr:MAG: Rieske (2Fe-2S) protein [Actinobacteria bacterium QS_8_72_14]